MYIYLELIHQGMFSLNKIKKQLYSCFALKYKIYNGTDDNNCAYDH